MTQNLKNESHPEAGNQDRLATPASLVQPPAPEAARRLSSQGYAWQREKRLAEAEQAFRAAVRMAPDSLELQLDLSLHLLSVGKFAEGWQHFRVRHDPRRSPNAVTPDLPMPPWRGESLESKTLFISTEQGMGDEIQLVRFLPMLRARGAKQITLMCKEALVPLFEHSRLADSVVPFVLGCSLPMHDYWVFPFEIPRYCGIDTPRHIPGRLPYLKAEPKRIKTWRKRLDVPGFKVGLLWRGNTWHSNDRNRSLPDLATLAPLWTVPGVHFFSLQKGEAEDEALNCGPKQALIHLGGDIVDMSDSAAIINQLDLLISVDSAPAHLAGALGKTCWVMLPLHGLDWRWGHEGDTTPWYPGVMRLFRQAKAGDWSEVISRLTEALEQDLKQHAPKTSGTTAKARRSGYRNLLAIQQKKVASLESAGKFQEAEQAHRALVKQYPQEPSLWLNLGNFWRHYGYPDEAEAAYRQAIALDPEHPSSHMNLGMLLIAQQRFSEGFTEYEARYHPNRPIPISTPDFLPFPRWKGEPLDNKAVMVWTEQGFGDQFMFARYLPLLKKMGARHVSLACKEPTQRLFRGLPDVDDLLVIKEEEQVVEIQPYDYWVMLLSLPHLGISVNAEHFKPRFPYLHADPELTQCWHKRLNEHANNNTDCPENDFKAGLVWRGNPKYLEDINRSLPGLDALAPFWQVEGVSFVSLQKEGLGLAEAAAPPKGQPIYNPAEHIDDFNDTAALICALDLVICVDSGVAHLAGALGKPCWIMLPAWSVDWRWGFSGETTHWYPDHLRLFRRTLQMSWEDSVDKVKQALEIAVRHQKAKTPKNQRTQGHRTDDLQTLRNKSIELYRSGQLQAAMNNQLKLTHEFKEPDTNKHADDFVLLACIFQAMSDNPSALKAMREHARLKPDDATAQENLIVALNRAKQPEEAAERLSRMDPQKISLNLLDSAANIYAQLKRFEESLQYGRKSLLGKDKKYCEAFRGEQLKLPSRCAFDHSARKRNVIAFSLWGTKPQYLIPAAENARAARHVYPSWTCRFYCDESVPADLVALLKNEGAQIKMMARNQLYEGLIWRFLVANDPDVDFFLVRDADSVINVQERVAVDEWLASDLHFHVLRGHYSHTDLILAGLWGGVGNVLPDMVEQANNFKSEQLVSHAIDQHFLRARVWPLIRDHVMIHDDLFHVLGSRPYPPYGALPPGRHIGQAIINK